MIPIYVVSQSGGRVYSLDDPLTVNDFAAVDGSGGSAYTPYLLSTQFPTEKTLGFYSLRKFRQRFDAPNGVTIAVTPWRDGLATGQTLTRTFATGAVGMTSTPLNYAASAFQLYLTLTGFTRPVELGNANVSMIRRRDTRGLSALG